MTAAAMLGIDTCPMEGPGFGQPMLGQRGRGATGLGLGQKLVRIDDPRRELSRGPFGRNLHLAREVRAAVRAAGFHTPVVAAGGINTFAMAEGALQSGDCDFVASARQSLADPDWFLKLESGRGEEIRRCKFTNYCEGLDQSHRQVTCQLWDRDFALADPRAPLGSAPQRSSDGKRRLTAPPWDGSQPDVSA